MPRLLPRLPCSFLNSSICSKSTFALSFKTFLSAFKRFTSSFDLSRSSLFFCASSTYSRVLALSSLRSLACVLASAFNSFLLFLCSSEFWSTTFLFSIISFNMLNTYLNHVWCVRKQVPAKKLLVQSNLKFTKTIAF